MNARSVGNDGIDKSQAGFIPKEQSGHFMQEYSGLIMVQFGALKADVQKGIEFILHAVN
jgi:hypothetical protein